MENVEQVDQGKKSPFKFVLPIFILLIIGILGFGVYEYFRIAPRDVRFTNVTSSSVTVSWNTKSPTSATALVFEGDNFLPLTILGLGGERFYDTRDVRVAELNAASEVGTNRDSLTLTMDDFETEVVVENMGEYYTHHVTVTGLESEMEYSFMVGDQLLFRRVKDVNKNKVVKTLVVPQSVEAPYPAYGSVKDAEGSYDKPIDQLIPVSDAIVYFSYYDELTGERSSVFSSSVTEDGNWYVDVSMAIDSLGQPFLETYGTVDSEIFVDLVVDAGVYGIWDTRREDLSMSPAEPIVVNFPEKANVIDVQNPMGRQGVEFGLLSNPFVHTVLAARPAGNTPPGCSANACQFAGYCGPCQRQCSDGYWYDCDCSVATLSARNCAGDNVPPGVENPITCNGVSLGTVSRLGSDCKVCSRVIQNGYYVGRWLTDNTKYNPAENCAERQTCTPDDCSDASDGESPYASEASCKSGGNSCVSGDYDNGCNGTLTCWKREESPPETTPEADTPTEETCQTCAEVSENEYVYSSQDECEVGGNSCVFAYYYDERCTRNLTCWKVDDACVSSSCADLSDDYNLDRCFPVELRYNCYQSSIIDNCGRPKVCYLQSDFVLDYAGPGGGQTIPVESSPPILAGTKCPEYDSSGNRVVVCYCIGGVDGYRRPGQWCRQTKLSSTLEGSISPDWRRCKEGSEAGQVCWENGNTCKLGTQPEGIEALYCNGAPPVGLNLPEKDSKGLFSLGRYVKSVHAQQGEVQYLLDSETGMFVNLPLGVYVVEYEGETYSVLVDSSGDQVQTLLYIDVNKNGQYDKGMDKNLGEDAAVLKISPVELVYNYSLKEGFNFVAFPFLVETDYDVSSGAALLLELNERYGNSIYSISKYDGRWKMVGQNSELYGVNDFQLLPGQGYVIKAKEDVSITLTGQPVKYESAGDSAPVTLFEGWNLIGLYGTGVKTYTAKSMIADINASNFTADNVSKWEKEKQSYAGFQFSEGQEYGFDFPINSLESVFVRVLEGRGNWQPKLRSK
ncbi:MAG TPA: fibronectin type III domain-containing protein [Candidatus Dojkabacteria bacterium]|nr:fibronectin type III domain-containing protein [Candidatus Dojkabacteria bacterium]